MLIRAAAYLIVFLLLACLVTVISAAVYVEPEIADREIADPAQAPSEAPTSAAETLSVRALLPSESKERYIPRLTAPTYDNACYYSDDNAFYAASYGMPNCTCYAWGRAYELLGEKPELCLYDACMWYGYNRERGIYDYGSEPREGAIACWEYADGGSGHVAVVESVDGDTVTFSNSAYSGAEFYLSSAPADDPSNGIENMIFQGYIYVDRTIRKI